MGIAVEGRTIIKAIHESQTKMKIIPTLLAMTGIVSWTSIRDKKNNTV